MYLVKGTGFTFTGQWLISDKVFCWIYFCKVRDSDCFKHSNIKNGICLLLYSNFHTGQLIPATIMMLETFSFLLA